MKNRRAILLALAMAFQTVAVCATVQTNQVQQKAIDLLHKTMDGLERKPATNPPPAAAPAPPPAVRDTSFAEAEKLYLQGKISAKEFQQYLEDHRLDPTRLKQIEAQTRALEVLHQIDEAGQGTASPAAAIKSLGTAPGPDESGLSEVEKKMDELLRLQAAREKAAGTNVAVSTVKNAAPAASAPKTKRERMDQLLKLLIEGKIPEAEYNEKRAKLIAEPE